MALWWDARGTQPRDGTMCAAQRLSLADLIQLAGAYAVELTGGPAIRVALGRADATSADPAGRLPAESLSGPAMRAHFEAAGFSARELLALAGAHTIGGKGFGEPLLFDNTYFKTLLEKCAAPVAGGEGRTAGRV